MTGVQTCALPIWFDYKRTSDKSFRAALRTQNRLAKQQQKHENTTPSAVFDFSDNEPIPTTAEEVQQYFIKWLQRGEELAMAGVDSYPQAARCFINALAVYPDPNGLLEALAQSLPQQLVLLVVQGMKQAVDASNDSLAPGTATITEEVE